MGTQRKTEVRDALGDSLRAVRRQRPVGQKPAAILLDGRKRVEGADLAENFG